MFLVWMQVIVAVALANPQNPLNTSCTQTKATDTPEDLFTGDTVHVISDCLASTNTTANSTAPELAGDPYTDANTTTKETVTTSSPPAWFPVFKTVRFATRGICMPIVSILGMIGNSITLHVLRKGVLPPSSTVYVLGMTVAELMYSINRFPAAFIAYDGFKDSIIVKSFTSIRYSYFIPLTYIFHTAGVYTIICFTIERFIAVNWPLKAKELSTKHRARVAVISCYIFGFAVNCVRFFVIYPVRKIDPVTQEAYLSYAYTDFGRSQTVSDTLNLSYFVILVALPFVFLICLNSAIILCVWLARRKRLMMASTNTKDNKGNSRETQITRMLICIVMAYLFCHTCSAIYSVWAALNENMSNVSVNEFGYYIINFATVLPNTNPFLNFILYVVSSSAFRSGLKSLFCPRRKARATSGQTKTPVVQ